MRQPTAFPAQTALCYDSGSRSLRRALLSRDSLLTTSRTSVRLLAVATVISLGGFGCSWAHQPVADDDLDVSWEIEDPTRTTPEAELFLSDDGLWGYTPTDPAEFEPEWQPGELLELATDEYDHLFAVVEAAAWGYRFQRLDDAPVRDELGGRLRAATAERVDEREDLCRVDSPGRFDEDCPVGSTHRRWHLYPLEQASGTDQEAAPLVAAGDFADVRNQPGFPVARVGLAGADALTSWVETDGEPAGGAHLAVRGQSRDTTETTLRAQVVYDDNCSGDFTASELVDAVPLEAVNAPVDTPIDDHPVAVEQAAAKLGADAIVQCRADRVELLVPMLTRPLLATPTGRYLAPPPIGLRAAAFAPDSPAIAEWARAGALTAVGDNTGAGFWIERGLQRDNADEVRRVGLRSMPVAAVAGRPELAMRVGRQFTEGMWNPENDPDYLDGLIVLLELLERTEALRDRIEHREQLVDRRYPHRAGWYRWAGVRIELAERRSSHGPAYRDTIDGLQRQGLDGWALAVWTTLQLYDLELPIVDDPDDLIPRFAEYDAEKLWRRLIGEDIPFETACEPGADTGCAPTSYGWRRRAGQIDDDRLVAELRATAATQLDDDFAIRYLGEVDERSEADELLLELWLGVAPLVPGREFPEANRAVIDVLQQHLERRRDEICGDVASWRTRFANAAARADAPIVSQTRREWIELLRWWAHAGVEALCATPRQFVDSIEQNARETTAWAHTALPMAETALLAHPGDRIDTQLLTRTARLAARLGDDRMCTRWNLGVAVGAARAGELQTADEHLVAASNCRPDDDRLAHARDFVAGYLDFERGAGRNIIGNENIEQAVNAATRGQVHEDECIGLSPLGFQLDSYLPSSVMRIAERFDAQPSPVSEFTRLTAGRIVDSGTAAYVTGIRDIRRGRLRTAARALEEARHQFAHIGHRPGLARVEFIDEVVFDRRLEQLAHDDDDDDRDVELSTDDEYLEKIRTGRVHRLAERAPATLESVDDELSIWLAVFLIERDDDIARRIGDSHRLPPALCHDHSQQLGDGDTEPTIDVISDDDH